MTKSKSNKNLKTSYDIFLFFFFLGKVYITLSNYYLIVNVPPKLLIVSMSHPKLPKHVNVHPNDKNTLNTIIKIFFLKNKIK
jgi:hypothetical protein